MRLADGIGDDPHTQALPLRRNGYEALLCVGETELSDTPDSSARQTNPTLSDYARSLWRRKAIVIAGLAAGLALGIAVFPRVLPSSPDYEARTRLDVRPLTLESQDAANGGSGSSGAAQP